MFSAYFLTCMLSAKGTEACSVAYTEMPDYVQEQEQCDRLTEQMHDFVVAQVQADYPTLFLARREAHCYGGPLSAGEVARDEHAKLLEAGINASLNEIP